MPTWRGVLHRLAQRWNGDVLSPLAAFGGIALPPPLPKLTGVVARPSLITGVFLPALTGMGGPERLVLEPRDAVRVQDLGIPPQ